MRAALALGAALFGFVACGPPQDEPLTLSGADRARIVTHIAKLLKQSFPEVAVTPDDLGTPSPLLRALRATGVVVGSSFSPKGLAASRSCPDQSTVAGARCFPIGHYRVLDVIDAVESPRALDHDGTRSYRFSFRTIPSGAIAEHLASSGALVCSKAHGAEPWSGTATISVGTFSQDIEPNPISDVIEIYCPVTPATFKVSAHRVN